MNGYHRFLIILFSGIYLCSGCQPQDYDETEDSEKSISEIDSSYITVTQALKISDTIATVKGYIGGCIEGTSISKAQFTPPFSKESNIFITDNKNDKLFDKCFPIQLPAGSIYREELNLVRHPENYHKIILIRGKLERYFSRCGIKKISAYKLLNDISPTEDTIKGNGYIVVPF